MRGYGATWVTTTRVEGDRQQERNENCNIYFSSETPYTIEKECEITQAVGIFILSEQVI